jgi:transcriptional regulator with XRE-family HTH domain
MAGSFLFCFYRIIDDFDTPQIIRQIIEKRKQKGLTQTELAKQLHTSQAAIARIESGKQNITIGYVENIAKALGCKVKIIFE